LGNGTLVLRVDLLRTRVTADSEHEKEAKKVAARVIVFLFESSGIEDVYLLFARDRLVRVIVLVGDASDTVRRNQSDDSRYSSVAP
jgi:hypothetical protein